MAEMIDKYAFYKVSENHLRIIAELKARLELADDLLSRFGVHNCKCSIYLAEQVKLSKNIPLDSAGCDCGFDKDMTIIRSLLK